MGRKTNPIILRVGSILRSWDSKWFADKPSDFRGKLLQDIAIRNHITKSLRTASISRIEIARQRGEVMLTIHTSRPAIVIGRGGSGIERLQKELERLISRESRVKINVQEVRNPDTDAVAVATQIVEQLERRMPYRRILKQAVQRSRQAGARGIRVSLAGRLNGADIARTEWLTEGNVPLHTMRADISYADHIARTTYGAIGVKVWINRGDLLAEKETPEPGQTVRRRRPAPARRRRTSLAEKARKTKAPSRKKSK